MFVIFGWLKESRPVREALSCYCYVCQRERAWLVVRETEWVTFFGQRTIPFLSKDAVGCSGCEDLMPISRSQSRAMAAGAMTDVVELIHRQQLSCKSETQRRFLESVRTASKEREAA